MNSVIVDSGFWYALFDPRDQYHLKANELVEYLNLATVIVPFPILYETLNTRFNKKRQWVSEFNRFLFSVNTIVFNDEIYKNSALSLTIESSNNTERHLSLVDMVLRLMLDDVNVKIDYLITFNAGDFIDVCQRRNILIISE